MNEPRMNFFSRIYYSIAGFSKYGYFLRQSTGKAVIYLLLISLVIAVITYIPAVNEYNNVIDDIIANFDSKIPDFTLANGKLEVSGTMPIIIDDGGTATIVIDTSPNVEEAKEILDDYDIVILVTRDDITQKNYVDRTVTSLSSLPGLALTRADVKQSLPIMKPLGIVIFIIMGIFFICGKFISALIISLLGLIINSARNTNLSYRSIFRISIYSMTLPLLLCTLLQLLSVNIPFMLPLLFYIISAVYVYGVIDSIKKKLNSIGNTNMTE